MKRNIYILILFTFTFPLHLFAQSQAQVTIDYIKKYKGIAIKEMRRTGIPASITLAQAIVESGSGESILAKQANNHFGIKCKTEWTGEKIYKDDDSKNECFRVYPNADSSFIDHSNFIKNRPYYASLFELDPVDDSAWAYGLKKAGYATEKEYPNSLLKVIDLYELSQYNFPELVAEDSLAALANNNNNNKEKDTALLEVKVSNSNPAKEQTSNVEHVNHSPAKDTIEKNTLIKDTIVKIVKVTDTIVKVVVVKDTVVKLVTVKDTIEKVNKVVYPKNQKFKINGTAAIWAEKDRSFLEIANTYNVPLYKLYSNNELEETDLVQKDQLLFLSEKKKESDKKIHTARKGESFYEIAQMEGIQLTALKNYNSSIKENEIKEGTLINLFNMPKDPIKTAVPEKTKTIIQPKDAEKNISSPTPKKNKFKIF